MLIWKPDADLDKKELQTGECAKKMGFDGCKDEDEQGTVYIIPMFGREEILVLEGDNWNGNRTPAHRSADERYNNKRDVKRVSFNTTKAGI